MPVRVFVTLPPADGPAVTEDVLAQQVMQEFMAMRHAGSSVELLCSVSSRACSRRLRSATHSRTIVFYWRGVGAASGIFAEEIVGLRCFLYTLRDYAETRDLEVHVAFSELRCCVKDEDARAVRQADGSVGALLREHLLQKDALHRWCDEAVKAAQADGGAGGADRALWRAPPPAPSLMRLARQLRSYGCEGGNFGWLRRRAAKEVAAIMTASDTPARHMSALRLRRHVAHCLQSWVPANSGRRSAKDLFMAAMG
ncbi:hypothetical protein TcBrA4_0006120 [Trypanosoma cruzi]|nr:hypothetical protein TcBrA4_0006120 [Trypanosoma cruzi]